MTTAMNVLISQESWSQSLDSMRTSFDPIQHNARLASSSSLVKASSGKPDHKRRRSSVLTYTKRDILSGRGGLANKHFGNKVFRRLIKHNKDLYRQLKSKRKQDLLIKSILLAVQSQGGRFLREDKASNTWYEIDEKDAWTKTSQALREPDKKTGDEGSDDGHGSEQSSSSSTRKVAIPAPTSFVRQYTTDNPPNADRRIFDQVAPSSSAEHANDDEALIAPMLLEMSTTTFTQGTFAFPSQSHSRPQEISIPAAHRQLQQPESYSNDYAVPPALQRESTSIIAQQALGLRPIDWTLDYSKPSALMRSDTIGTFVEGNFNAASSSPPPPTASASTCPPPLLHYTSSAFLRGLDEVDLYRQESTTSLDFSSFAAGADQEHGPTAV